MATQRDITQQEIEEAKSILDGIAEENKDRLWNYVYIVKCNNFYKIGNTFNLESRLNSLQCGNPYPLIIVFSVKHPQAKELEIILHKHFDKKRYFREWFELTDDDLIEIRKMVERGWK